MLEASDDDSMDQVSPFLGAISDFLYGRLNIPEITEVVKCYVDLISF